MHESCHYNTTRMTFTHHKSLGQHFLHNAATVHAIVQVAGLTRDDVVVEVGPGEGVLTAALADAAGRVVAIEKDARLMPILKQRFADTPHVTIVQDDILHSNIEDVATRVLEGRPYMVVANIPYYITAPILRLFMETQYPPHKMVVMVQQEVAQRLCAAPGQMSVLAIAAQYYCDVHCAFSVPRTDFTPMPAVDSAVVVLTRRANVQPDADFFRIVRIGFSARRKTLSNNIANGLHLSKQAAANMLAQAGIAPGVRAQELDVAQWRALAAVVTTQSAQAEER